MARLTILGGSVTGPTAYITCQKVSIHAKATMAPMTAWGATARALSPGLITYDATFEGFLKSTAAAPGAALATFAVALSSGTWTWTTKSTLLSWRITGTASDGSVKVTGAIVLSGAPAVT